MAICNIQEIKLKSIKYYKMITDTTIILLDYPYLLYGKNFSIPSFSNTPKCIKVVVPILETEIDEIFLTNPTLSVLFVERLIKIYCTQAVYEQLILKYEEYEQKMMWYEEEDDFVKNEKVGGYKICTLSNTKLNMFKSNVEIVTFNQHIHLLNMYLIPIPAGTNLGWVNYKIVDSYTKKSLCYITSYKYGNRFSKRADSIKGCDYYIINCNNIKSDSNDIGDFNSTLNTLGNNISDSCDYIIPVNYTQSFVDIIFHILSIIEKYYTPIYICSKIFNRLELLLNIQSELISNSALNVASNNIEVFPINKYKFLHIVDSIEQLADLSKGSSFTSHSSKIIFIDELTFIDKGFLSSCSFFSSYYKILMLSDNFPLIDHSLTYQSNSSLIDQSNSPLIDQSSSSLIDQSNSSLIDHSLTYQSNSSNVEYYSLSLEDSFDKIIMDNCIKETLTFIHSSSCDYTKISYSNYINLEQYEEFNEIYIPLLVDPSTLLYNYSNNPRSSNDSPLLLFLSGDINYSDYYNNRKLICSFNNLNNNLLDNIEEDSSIIVDNGYLFPKTGIYIKLINDREYKIVDLSIGKNINK